MKSNVGWLPHAACRVGGQGGDGRVQPSRRRGGASREARSPSAGQTPKKVSQIVLGAQKSSNPVSTGFSLLSSAEAGL